MVTQATFFLQTGNIDTGVLTKKARQLPGFLVKLYARFD
jgi:hypothetical protein